MINMTIEDFWRENSHEDSTTGASAECRGTAVYFVPFILITILFAGTSLFGISFQHRHLQMSSAHIDDICADDHEGVNTDSSSVTCQTQTATTICTPADDEQQHPSPIRQELIECLLAIVVNWIPFQLDEDFRQAILIEPTGNCHLSGMEGGFSVFSPKILHGITWRNPSLHWTWQEETSTCYLSFLAPMATLDDIPTSSGDAPLALLGTIESFQWTLELSSAKHSNTMSPPLMQTEVHRVEPMILSPSYLSDGQQVLSLLDTIGPVQSFWKMSSIKVLHVELQSVAFFGMLSKEACRSATNSSDSVWKLKPKPSMSCGEINLVGSRPSTSAEFIQLAKVISILDLWTIAGGIQWPSAPRPHLKGLSFLSLADIYREVVSFLDNVDNSKQQNTDEFSVPSADRHPESSASNTTTARMKQSIVDSLVITGGLMATGASFVTPIGAAVSVAAVGVKDGIVSAAEKGKSTRNDEKYKVGDVTRGVVARVKERREERRERAQRQSDNTLPSESYTGEDSNDGSSTGRLGLLQGQSKGRYVGVVGSSVGAAVGSLVAGPVGLLAGSLAGGAATREVIKRSDRDLTTSGRRPIDPDFIGPEDGDEEILSQLGGRRHQTNGTDEQHDQSMQQKKWKFGDNIRNVVQRGKASDGRNADSAYKLGDFSKGLFSKK